jgi:hypothetical protein
MTWAALFCEGGPSAASKARREKEHRKMNTNAIPNDGEQTTEPVVLRLMAEGIEDWLACQQLLDELAAFETAA